MKGERQQGQERGRKIRGEREGVDRAGQSRVEYSSIFHRPYKLCNLE